LRSLLHDSHLLLPVTAIIILLLWWYIVTYSLVVIVSGHRQNFLGMFLPYNMLVEVFKGPQAVTFLRPGIYPVRQDWKNPIINKEKCSKIQCSGRYSA
jgi:hypothetical protein